MRTSPLHSRGVTNKGTKSQKWIPHPCLLKCSKKGQPVHSRGFLTKGKKIKSGFFSLAFLGA